MSDRAKLTPEQLMALLEAVIRKAPSLGHDEALTDGDLRWLGRAEALLVAAAYPSGLSNEVLNFRRGRTQLGAFNHSREMLLAPLHTAYCQLELAAPSEAQGAFIPAGDTWNGYAALVKLMQQECDDLLLVDPYLDASLYLSFAPHSVARTGLRCLTCKRNEYNPALSAAALRWSTEPIAEIKQIQVRYAPSGSLHDRLIIFDRSVVYLISQSLKDIAKRSPASVSRAEPELASLKVAHYDALWSEGEPLL